MEIVSRWSYTARTVKKLGLMCIKRASWQRVDPASRDRMTDDEFDWGKVTELTIERSSMPLADLRQIMRLTCSPNLTVLNLLYLSGIDAAGYGRILRSWGTNLRELRIRFTEDTKTEIPGEAIARCSKLELLGMSFLTNDVLMALPETVRELVICSCKDINPFRFIDFVYGTKKASPMRKIFIGYDCMGWESPYAQKAITVSRSHS